MILVALIVLAFTVFGVIVTFAGCWVKRPKVDWQRLDVMERDVGIGPPYSSEFPKLRPQIKERVW